MEDNQFLNDTNPTNQYTYDDIADKNCAIKEDLSGEGLTTPASPLPSPHDQFHYVMQTDEGNKMPQVIKETVKETSFSREKAIQKLQQKSAKKVHRFGATRSTGNAN